MNNWVAIQYEQERHNDWLRTAEHQRLVQAASAGQSQPSPRHGSALNSVAQRMRTWGMSLQMLWKGRWSTAGD